MIDLHALGNFGYAHKPEMVAEVFSHLLNEKAKTPHIIINFVDDNYPVATTKIQNQIICNIKYPFAKDFSDWSNERKNLVYIEIIRLGLKEINLEYQLVDEEIILNVIAQIIDCRFEIDIPVITSSSKKIKATVTLTPGVEKFIYKCVIWVNEMEMFNFHLLTAIRDTYLTKSLFNKIKFQNDEVSIVSKGENIKFVINLTAKKMEIINNSSVINNYYEVLRFKEKFK